MEIGNWTKLGYKAEPTEKDLPFITWGVFTGFEIWDDTDWFFELTTKEQYERMFWGKLNYPIKLKK